jgi:hypothetical protein
VRDLIDRPRADNDVRALFDNGTDQLGNIRRPVLVVPIGID